jgi:hypothetical protein
VTRRRRANDTQYGLTVSSFCPYRNHYTLLHNGPEADESDYCRALGTPLDWPEAKASAKQVREWGIQQLLANWKRAKGKKRDALLWGDEVRFLHIAGDKILIGAG